ncbi:MAG: quinone-dependent dihydroorotate dehydrogenase [Puniceicoccales bacterium]|jgi:dihydroorotate dehydrogenase|nr:quinone-dependent dihydroorotate dehydrogenase [Puniceicoccales bacterium]
MDFLYEKILRPLFFTQDAETAHEISIRLLRILDAIPFAVHTLERINLRPRHSKPIRLFDLDFPNRVGLAAGFDKYAQVWPTFGALGFGHAEIGTFTLHPQDGNPKPRVFRYPQAEAVVNSFGFPNPGAEVIAHRLAQGPGKGARTIPIGINIGKSKITPLDTACEDYVNSFRLLADHADFLVINISSPNTPGLRELQGRAHLTTLLETLQRENLQRTVRLNAPRIPILLKIAPDLSYPQLEEILAIATAVALDGIVATNTTIERPQTAGDMETRGGLSGRPLLEKSLSIVRFMARASNGKLPIIGCGGICHPDDAARFMDEGASLVQIFTGMIYRGPFFPAALARTLAWSHRPWA